MIRSFLYGWIAYWLLVALLPVHSIYPAVFEAFALQLGFVILVVLGYFSVLSVWKGPQMPDLREGELPDAKRLMSFAVLMSLLGLLCLIFDKVFIQHIDYSSGLAAAREQWREMGEEREGKASSMFSAIGYLLSSGYYMMLVLVVCQPQSFSSKQRLRIFGFAFFFALANSIITGGRSNFLLIAAVAIAAFTARRGSGMRKVFANRRQRTYIASVMGLAMCYIVYVFYSRAQAGEQLVYVYVSNFLPVMGLDFDAWYVAYINEGSVGAITNMLVLVLGYLSHSFATVAAIVDAPHEDKVMMFGNVTGILYKLGLTGRPDDQWFLVGKFPSVPGALWHQFGVLGYTVGAFMIGAVAGLSRNWAAFSRRRLLPLGFYALTCATLLLTPYVFAPDLLSFPFVATGLVLLAILSRVRVGLTPNGLSLRILIPKKTPTAAVEGATP